jgi:RimJ/RimL family protein N-acetyltransferase
VACMFSLNHTLPNGLEVRLREQTDGDRAVLAEFFAGLSQRSRYLRFMAGVPAQLPPTLLDILDAADGRSHVGLIAVHQGRAIGTVRYIRAADGAPEADVGIAVADELHGQGLGRLMLRELMQRAAASGIDRLRFELLAENRAARALVGGFGASLRSDGQVTFAVARTRPEIEPIAA